MTPLPPLSPDQAARPRAALRRPAAALAGGLVLALAAGCSSGSAPGHKSGSAASQAQQGGLAAITAAVRTSRRITSVTATLSEHVTGAAAVSIHGTLAEQVKPSVAMQTQLNSTIGAQAGTIDAVITGPALYLKMPALTRQLGKPWLKIPLSALKAGKSSLGALLGELTQSSPLSQLPMFGAAAHVVTVGHPVIGGTATTEYAGTITPSAAAKALPAGLRAQLTPALRTMKGPIRFTVWIDGQHQVKQMRETEQVSGQSVTTTVLITSVNQPVHITAPPAGQVAQLPAGQSATGL